MEIIIENIDWTEYDNTTDTDCMGHKYFRSISKSLPYVSSLISVNGRFELFDNMKIFTKHIFTRLLKKRPLPLNIFREVVRLSYERMHNHVNQAIRQNSEILREFIDFFEDIEIENDDEN
jgi:hypothetical protein